MDRQEALKRLEEIKTPALFGDFVGYYGARDLIDEIYKTPCYLRNVLARLRELPEHDRKVWMDEIMHEFANDYGSVKYTLGYEQGKFEGAVEAEKSNTVVIPRFVADWIEVCKAHLTTSLYTAMSPNFMKENNQGFNLILWIKKTSNQYLFARAWLDGYDVEQEKRYRIKMKNEEYNHTVVIGDYTREEIEATGFGWVFDCEDVEVQEVE